MNDIPVLETERCLLRPHREADFTAYVALRADPRVFRFTSGRPWSEEEVWRRITGAIGQWSLRGYGMWAVEDKATGALLGETGFSDNWRDYNDARRGLPEAGWWLAADSHGRGYAKELVRAAHEWADVTLKVRCTFCAVMAHNAASIRLAEGVGYVFQRENAYREHKAFVFERSLPRSGD